MPLPISCAPASWTPIASPDVEVAGHVDDPHGQQARAALAQGARGAGSTVTVPCDGLAYFSHSLKLEWRAAWARKRVPAGSPAHARGERAAGQAVAR